MSVPLRRTSLVAILLSIAWATQAAPPPVRTPISHERLWMMKRVGTPQVSPDGKWVVFSVLEPAYDQDKEVSDLWLVPADASAAPRRLTHTKAPEKGVDWSPDSRRLAFATKREGDELEQIYILDLADGGEARRLTNVATGALNPHWRPDGQAILFESSVYPHALDDEANKKIIAEHKARKYNVRVYEHFPVRYWNQWLDDHQPTILVQEIAEGSSAHDVLSATALAQTPGFSGVEGETSVSLEPLWPRRTRDRVRSDHRALEFGLGPRGLSPVPGAGHGGR